MLTKFDWWLKRKFGQETHIYLMNDPGKLPRKVKRYALPNTVNSEFSCKLVISSESYADKYIAKLKAQNINHRSRVVDKNNYIGRRLATKDSLLLSIIWKIIIVCVVAAVLAFVWNKFIPWFRALPANNPKPQKIERNNNILRETQKNPAR